MTERVYAMLLLSCLLPSRLLLSTAVAQAPTIVVTPRSAFTEQVAERLRAGSDAQAAAPIILVDDATSGCEPERTIEANETTQATITIAVGPDNVVELCVRSRAGVSRRVLGPLPALDATAVEQVATVTEASLEALQSQDESHEVAPAPHVEESTEAPAGPAPTEPTRPVAPPQIATPSVAMTKPVQPPAPLREPARSDLTYALTASYQPTLWNGDTIAHTARVSSLAIVSPMWLGAGLSVALPFDKHESGLGASFWALALDLRVGLQLTLGPNARFNVSVGPRLEWLFVAPFEEAGTGASSAPSSDAFSLGSVVELGPTIQVSGNVSAAFGVGAIFTHNARSYVVTQGDSYVRVMDQSVPRPYVHVGAQLAL